MKVTSSYVKTILNIIAGLLFCMVGVLVFMRLQQSPEPETGESVAPPVAPTPAIPPKSAVKPEQSRSLHQKIPPIPPSPSSGTKADVTQPLAIDPQRLAEAEALLARNTMYEQKARSTLPTLSLQTHNPVWALENEARERQRQAEAGQAASTGSQSPEAAGTTTNQGPQPAPESGPFGNIQPPESEIWLRIPVGNAREFRDIMAQHADMYRAETGSDKPVTVTLWVGGRVYARQQYK